MAPTQLTAANGHNNQASSLRAIIKSAGIDALATLRSDTLVSYALPLFDTIARRIECYEPSAFEPDLLDSFAVTTAGLLGEKL